MSRSEKTDVGEKQTNRVWSVGDADIQSPTECVRNLAFILRGRGSHKSLYTGGGMTQFVFLKDHSRERGKTLSIHLQGWFRRIMDVSR